MFSAIAGPILGAVGGQLVNKMFGGSSSPGGQVAQQSSRTSPVYGLSGEGRGANDVFDNLLSLLSPTYKQYKLGNVSYAGMPGLAKPVYDTTGMNYQLDQAKTMMSLLGSMLGVSESYTQGTGGQEGWLGPMAQAIAKGLGSTDSKSKSQIGNVQNIPGNEQSDLADIPYYDFPDSSITETPLDY